MKTLQTGEKKSLGRVFQNTGWLVAQNIFQYVLSAVIGILAARYIGPTNYGILNYGATLMALFFPFCTLGLNSVEVPAMVEEPEKTGAIVGTCFVLRLVSSCLSIALLTLVAVVMKPGNRLLIFVTFLQSLQFLFQSCDAIRLWFQKELLSKYTAIGSVIGNTACSLWRIILLARGASVEWFALTSVVQMLTNYLFVLPIFFAKSGVKLSFSLPLGWKLLKRGYHFILSGFTVAVTNYCGKLILAQQLGETELGYYSAASTLALMWIFVPQAIVSSANPVLLETKKNDPEHFEERYQMVHLVNLFLGVAAGLGMGILSKFLINFLYGEAYAPAAPLLVILAWTGLFTAIGESRGIWLFAEQKTKYVKYYCAVSAGASLVLNYLLIGLFGPAGACVAALVTGMIQALGAPLLFPGSRDFTFQYFRSFKQLPRMKDFIITLIQERRGLHG